MFSLQVMLGVYCVPRDILWQCLEVSGRAKGVHILWKDCIREESQRQGSHMHATFREKTLE